MKKKDILFLCQFFHPEYISSAQLPFDTACALHDAGFSVGVLCGYPREYLDGDQIPRCETIQGIHVRRLKYIQMDRSGFLGRIVNYFSFTFMVLLNLPEMANYRAVVVYSNPPILPWIASWAKVLFGTKLVFVSYDLYPEVAIITNTLREGSMICRLMEHINHCVYRREDRIVSLSREQRDYILKHRSVAKEDVAVIPNWHPNDSDGSCQRLENRFSDMRKDRFVVSVGLAYLSFDPITFHRSAETFFRDAYQYGDRFRSTFFFYRQIYHPDRKCQYGLASSCEQTVN